MESNHQACTCLQFSRLAGTHVPILSMLLPKHTFGYTLHFRRFQWQHPRPTGGCSPLPRQVRSQTSPEQQVPFRKVQYDTPIRMAGHSWLPEPDSHRRPPCL